MSGWRWTMLIAGMATATALAAAIRPPRSGSSPPPHRPPPDTMLVEHIRRLATEYDSARRGRLATVRTAEDWHRLAPVLRDRFRRSLGEFPARTPLNARIVGTLRREGYRVEKLVFESRPGLFVTANVYVPSLVRGRGTASRFPAIVSPVGHWAAGKAEPDVQAQCVSLARKGFVVLTWDPLGQGERSQYWDPGARRELVGASTSQHTRLGNQCALSGTPLANYFVWESIRALDYLQSRSDVDPELLGCTGASGGGTQTLYLAVLDERVKVALPSIFVSSQHRWLLTGLIADSEQVSFGWIRDGLDQPEWCALVAPRPLLINAAAGDFFPLAGTRETFGQARRIYRLLGADDAIGLRVTDGGHFYTRALREGAYEWFLSRLAGSHSNEVAETAFRPEPPSALWSTTSGHVDSPDAQTVFDINRARVAQLGSAHADTLHRWREHPERAREQILEALAVDPPESPPPVEIIASEHHAQDIVTSLLYWTEKDVYVPASHYAPRLGADARLPAVVLVDGGKETKGSRAIARRLARRGFHVLAIQPRGTGETRWDVARRGGGYDALLGAEANLTHNAWLLGTNLLGWRVRDVLAGLRCLRGRPGVDPSRTFLVGVEPAGATPALFAAALDGKVARTALVRPLLSYRSMADTKLNGMPSSLIPWGVLQRFDLPQVVALAAQRPLLLANVVAASGEPATADELATLGQDTIVDARAEIIQGVEEPFKLITDWLGAQAAPVPR